jgi:hypothetical protein
VRASRVPWEATGSAVLYCAVLRRGAGAGAGGTNCTWRC